MSQPGQQADGNPSYEFCGRCQLCHLPLGMQDPARSPHYAMGTWKSPESVSGCQHWRGSRPGPGSNPFLQCQACSRLPAGCELVCPLRPTSTSSLDAPPSRGDPALSSPIVVHRAFHGRYPMCQTSQQANGMATFIIKYINPIGVASPQPKDHRAISTVSGRFRPGA